ncbi:response regulator [Dyadobacter chenhuakuii]|uniref:Response regulator n=1 Tax=Dyadobacter chenhuakuii TaxID=2909339 RepID=A0ABY4XLD4_9BACT|nr:response regulator [Dyadobacter chenhuakuii]MCF2494123.1 response regulator [Dyadobacter chenhuakuii]USJ31251.1 response regulator [Dyadobacter chenhuakuii]
MKKRILIIDDDNDILELLKIVFRDSGHELIFSQTALDTNHISILHPDLILLDVRINGVAKKGAELCMELKADPKNKKLPVVLCSGEYNLPEIARECHADMYLTKPYDLMGLLFQVNRYLS